MNFKRYNESDNSWTDSHYIKGTDTDTITTLPTIIYPLAQTATIGLKGNTTQNGTPTPDNPVMPQGTGERTGNLLSEKYENRSINGVGAFTIDNNFDLWIGEVVAGQIYTISNLNAVYGFFTAKPMPNTGVTYNGSREIDSSGTVVITVPSDCTWIAVRVLHNADNAMLNTGSTPLPFEPYGYKIPILSAGQITPVYLGNVQTTRQIKKLVLTGNESWEKSSSNYFSKVTDSDSKQHMACICSHFSSSTQSGIYISGGAARLKIFGSSVPSEVVDTTTLKQWLSGQYTAGTPVCVWYVLATPQTAVVNEPLRKIGEYADTLSNVTIPVTAGGDTLSVDTTLQPSEVSVNYHGWHPVQSVHERESGQWD